MKIPNFLSVMVIAKQELNDFLSPIEKVEYNFTISCRKQDLIKVQFSLTF